MSHTADEAARQVQEHPECPWCGGRARLEWGETGVGIPCVAATCIVCGGETATAWPFPGGKASLDGLNAETVDRILAPAWYAWDNAWWVRQGAAMFEAGERLARDLETRQRESAGKRTEIALKAWYAAMTDTRRPW